MQLTEAKIFLFSRSMVGASLVRNSFRFRPTTRHNRPISSTFRFPLGHPYSERGGGGNRSVHQAEHLLGAEVFAEPPDSSGGNSSRGLPGANAVGFAQSRCALCAGLWGRNCRVGAPHRDGRLAIAGVHPQRFQRTVDHLGKPEIGASDAHAVGVRCACL